MAATAAKPSFPIFSGWSEIPIGRFFYPAEYFFLICPTDFFSQREKKIMKKNFNELYF